MIRPVAKTIGRGAFAYIGKPPNPVISGHLGKYAEFAFPHRLFDGVECGDRLKAVATGCFFNPAANILFAVGLVDDEKQELVIAVTNIEAIKDVDMTWVVLPVPEGGRNLVAEVRSMTINEQMPLPDEPWVKAIIPPPTTAAEIEVIEPLEPDNNAQSPARPSGPGSWRKRQAPVASAISEERRRELVALAGKMADQSGGRINFLNAYNAAMSDPVNPEIAILRCLKPKKDE